MLPLDRIKGFEAMRQLIAQAPVNTSFRLWLGSRDVTRTERAYSDLLIRGNTRHTATCLPIELSDLSSVKTFADTIRMKLPPTERIDVCLLCAAVSKAPSAANSNNRHGWSEAYIVNVVGGWSDLTKEETDALYT